MAKKLLLCEECDQEYTVTFKGTDEPTKCPFCGADIDTDWNASAEEED